MPNSAEHVSTAQAASQTGIPKRTILAAIARGDLPATKLGPGTATYTIKCSDLAAWAEQRQDKAS